MPLPQKKDRAGGPSFDSCGGEFSEDFFVPSPQVTGPMTVDGDGLPSEAEAKKLGDTAQPLFKLTHARLLFPFHRLAALNPFKMTFTCRKCGNVVMFWTD